MWVAETVLWSWTHLGTKLARSGIVDTAIWARLAFLAFRGSGAHVFVPECQDSHEMVGPSCCSTHAVKELPG